MVKNNNKLQDCGFPCWDCGYANRNNRDSCAKCGSYL